MEPNAVADMTPATRLVSPGAAARQTLPALSLAVVIYFAAIRKKVKSWPWIGRIAAFLAVWGALNIAARATALVLP